MMIYAACVIAGIIIGFVIACVQFVRMQDDFVNIFSKSPEK